MGKNSIVIYFGSEVLGQHWPFFYLPSGTISESHSFALYQNVIGVSIWILIALYMDYCKFYIAV